ncbi:hypothetical protein OF846_004735 [Rhodotorula toruloides]|nr:hypothetical protein OF846_004735 [Rhodotorula toruloides]
MAKKGGKGRTVAPRVPSRPLPTLDQPIVDRIIRFLDPTTKSELKTVAKCCLVSKTCLETARPILYRVIVNQLDPTVIAERKAMGAHLRVLEKPVPWDDEEFKAWPKGLIWRTSYDSGEVLDRMAKRMCLSLERHKHLQPLVKELHVFGQHGYGSLAKAVERVSRVLPKVDVVKFHAHVPAKTGETPTPEDEDASQAPLSIRLFQPLVQHRHTLPVQDLTVLGSYVRAAPGVFDGIAPMSSSFSDVSDPVDRETGRYFWEPTFSLQYLRLETVFSPKIFKHLTKTSCTTLTSLHIAIREHAIDLSDFPLLRHLGIAYSRPQIAVETMATATSHLRTLELRKDRSIQWDDLKLVKDELDISIESLTDGSFLGKLGALGDEFKSFNTVSTVLAQLPKSITRLTLSFYLGESYPALLFALAIPRWLPDLKVLDVADERRLNPDVQMGDVLPRGKKEREVREMREKVRAACEKRGVWMSAYARPWEEDEVGLEAIGRRP